MAAKGSKRKEKKPAVEEEVEDDSSVSVYDSEVENYEHHPRIKFEIAV